MTAHMPPTSAERLREPPASSARTRYSPQTTSVVSATVRESPTDRVEIVEREQIAGDDAGTDHHSRRDGEPSDLSDEPIGLPGAAAGRQSEEEGWDPDREAGRDREVARQQRIRI
jgi:hypothetical protein